MKNQLDNTYFKQLKNGHLKLFLILYLRWRGKKDASDKIIRVNEEGIYVSPFIYHEIYLYNLALHVEEERHVRSIMATQTEIEIFRLQIEQKENLPDSEHTIMVLTAKKQELQYLKSQEIEINQLHCQQIYNILRAKISAYWNGVLHADKNNSKIPSMIDIDQLVQGGEPLNEAE